MNTGTVGAAITGIVGTAMLVGVAFGQSIAVAGHSGHPSAPVLARFAAEDPTGDGVTFEFVADILDNAIATGNRHANAGRYGPALEAFHRASALAVQLGAADRLITTRHRLGSVNWALYERTGHLDYARIALGYWENEVSLYAADGYPPVFSAMAGYDIGRAYLALAKRERAEENTRRAAQAFRSITEGLSEAERTIVTTYLHHRPRANGG